MTLSFRQQPHVHVLPPQSRDERFRVMQGTAAPETFRARAFMAGQQTDVVQAAAELARNRRARVEEGNLWTGYRLNERLKKGIVRAAQHDGVGSLLQQRGQITLQQ